MAKTSASYTIMDYNDGISLIIKLAANHPESLAYNPSDGTYNPSWATTPLTITPSIYIGGKASEGDKLADCTEKKWYYRRTGSSTWIAIVSGANGFTITNDILGYSSNNLFSGTYTTVEFKFAFTYTDPTILLPFEYEVVKTFTRISNGTSVVIARAWSTNGEQFKNKTIPASLTLQAELIRGSISDILGLSYQWEKFASAWGNIASATSATLVVVPGDVDGSAQFRCKITDTDSASDTYNEVFTSNGILILDLTDPYQAVITSSGGAFIKNGAGSSTLTCKVYQNGVEVTSGLTYQWYNDGVAISGATSNTLAVTSEMITVKANFVCEVS